MKATSRALTEVTLMTEPLAARLAAQHGTDDQIVALDTVDADDAARAIIIAAAGRGIVPEAASSWFVPRIVGMSRVLEGCFSGHVFGADEALASGLIRSVHAPTDLMTEAVRPARGIADIAAPVSLALTRQMVWRIAGAAHPMAAHRIDSRAIAARSGSGDASEGVRSVLDKRAPASSDRVSACMPVSIRAATSRNGRCPNRKRLQNER